ncbi:uncharacterized protein LAJ45_11504 [Morchella importuna]|uniref:uncharacterized protein n=1 Tax=Morchella importuna TaxID=1174673 RepID=UPI001E8DF014|nr:uncharacterized protein LAJ45_11504 [Morchella importuna]KAH8144493.1 hypothetical protein LAJ45_11504 [Morchella importuna]
MGSIPSSVGAPNSGEEPSSPNYRILGPNAPKAVWAILCVMNLIMLFLQRPTLAQACESPNPYIAGLGARVSLWIPAGIVILTAGLGHFHREVMGAKNVHLALFGALIIYGCNLIQDIMPVGQVIGAMVLDCLLMIDSVPTSMKECLSARHIIRLANLTQYFGLVVTFVLIQRSRSAVIAPETLESDSPLTCDCFQIYWWGVIDSCHGISPSLVVYYLLRATGALHGSWLSLHYTGLYDECEKAERSDCLVPSTRIIPVIVFSVINRESTLMWYKGAQDVKSWGQTASILGVAVTSGSFLYALHLLFKTESVEKRQRIIRDYSHGTAFPRLAITPLVKSDMISFAGILQRLPAHLLSRSPFGKVRLRSPNHCRLSTIPGAWERITYQYRQWPGRDAEQLGIILIQTSVLGDIKQIGDLLAEGASTATKDRNGETALHIACKQRNVNIIKALIAGGAALEIESKDGWTALHFAVSGGPVEVLKCFLDLDINTSPQAKNGQTPFHLAIEGGNLELLHVMLEMKPHLDLGDKTGLTPLHLASELQDPDPTLLLLVTGANPNLKDKRGEFLERKMLVININPNSPDEDASLEMEGGLNFEDLDFRCRHIESCVDEIAEYEWCYRARPGEDEGDEDELSEGGWDGPSEDEDYAD